MIKNFYMHFTIEHLYGHHKKVATPDDPATSQKGMTLYQFLPKSIIGSYISAFKINPIFTTLTTIGSFLFFSLMYKVGGLFLLAIAFLSGFGGALVLEVINYIEHYGLERKRNADGSYERVTIRHSWNAPHRFTNYMFYKLQRHSDHHENSLKPYQTLCSYEDSPQLPHGYIGCVIIAIFPSVEI
jgi:alkane 1-monooxygenase